MTLQPVIFVGHGSPMNIVAHNNFTKMLRQWGQELEKPEAILVVSAHWRTHGAQITAEQNPKTIYDFGGFPEELYQVSYPAPGSPKFARQCANTFDLVETKDWGLDHGAWSVLVHMYPQANIPILQLSLNRDFTLQEHYQLGQKLKGLRSENVLILASGNLVHNLRQIDFNETAKPFEWAVTFDQMIKQKILVRADEDMIHLREIEPDLFLQAHPTSEHYLPLLYALGASEKSESVQFLFEEIQNGSISMRSVQFG